MHDKLRPQPWGSIRTPHWDRAEILSAFIARGVSGLIARRVSVLSWVLLPVLSLGIAQALAWKSTEPFPSLTPDSIQYLSAARSLAEGRGLTSTVTPIESAAPEEAFTFWPPVYPLILSLGGADRTGGDPPAPLPWARWVNLAAFALTFVPLGFLARAMAGPRGVAPVLAFYAVFLPAHLVSSFLWSETLFVLFLYLSFCSLLLAMERPSRPRIETLWFLFAGVMAGLATSTRYIGAVGIAAGAATIAARAADDCGRRTVRRLLAFVIPALLPLLLLSVRNLRVAGTPIPTPSDGVLLPPQAAFLGLLQTLTRDWIVPSAAASGVARLAATLLGAGAFLWMGISALRRFGPETFEATRPRLTGAVLLLSFAAAYLLVLVAAAARVPLDPINTRLLAPAYPAMLLLGATLLRGAWRHRGSGRTERAGLLASCIALLLLNAAASARFAEGPRETRDLSRPYWRTISIAGDRWRGHPAFARLRALPPRALVASNIWESVALQTGLPVKPLPGPGEARFPGCLLAHPGAYVLIAADTRPERVGRREMDALAAAGLVSIVGAWPDVSLYRVRPPVAAGSAAGGRIPRPVGS